MIVCHCNRVSDGTIRDVIRNGASSRAEVTMACRAGRSCGGCVRTIDRIIDAEAHSECGANCDCVSKLAAAS